MIARLGRGVKVGSWVGLVRCSFVQARKPDRRAYNARMKRRTLRFHSFDEVLADADRLLAAGYDRAGSWSLAQAADHLTKVVAMSMDGFPSMLPWFMRLGARWFALGAILKHEQFTARITAPPYLQPADGLEDREAVERLRAAAVRFAAHAGPLHPSPAFGTLTAVQWREVHLWHCEHHFSFLTPRG